MDRAAGGGSERMTHGAVSIACHRGGDRETIREHWRDGRFV